MVAKETVLIYIRELRKDAKYSERDNKIEFKEEGLSNDAKMVLVDDQYWRGYNDAIDNFEKRVKRFRL